jgi:arginine exporter protein ArgO
VSGGLGGAALAGLVAGYGVAVPVGAIGALLVSLTARTSLRVGAAAALGVATADGIYCAVAVLGGAAAARLIEPVAEPLRWAAVVVLLVLAARTAHTAWKQHRDGASAPAAGGLTTPWRAYAALLALTMLNPSTIIYFAALVLGRQAAGTDGAAAAVVFVVAALVASASWQLLLAGSGGVLGRLLTSTRGRFLTTVTSSVVIAALAVGLAVG